MRFNDIVDVYRAVVATDDYGTHRDWSNPRRIVSAAAAVALPQWSNEKKDLDRELAEISVDIYLRPVDVRPSDRIKVNGVWYEVYGQAIVWKGRTNTYMRIRARRLTNG